MPIELILILILGGGILVMLRLGKVPPGGYLEVHPQHAGLLRSLGLTRVQDFLNLTGVIVGGHQDRNVIRADLQSEGSTICVYLKCEYRVPWSVRLSSWWAGLGWCSRSLREGRVLQALEREGFAAPSWMAVGESSDGRAFLLLLAVPEARELRSVLPHLTNARRRRLIVQLAQDLARLHTCGLVHPDLYAGHVLVEGVSERLVFIDWARCQRRSLVGLAQRARALAALNATLPITEVSPLERLLALRAYLRASQPELRAEQQTRLMRLLERFREQLRRRRHVVEKSQAPRESTQQTWQKIEGEELCVASALEEVLPGDPGWLSLRRTGPLRSRWLASPEGMPLRLQRRRHRGLHLRRLFAWFRGREYTPPEQKRAHLLLRLERYHVPVPKVLAMGRVWQGVGSVEAFLLTCPLPRTLNLDQWLDRCSNPTQRQAVLSSLGQLLRKMHSAGCYLDSALSWRGIGVQLTNGGPRAVLQWVDGLRLRRRLQERPARADLTRCLKLLRHLGCGESECRAFVNAYDHAGRSDRLHIPMTASVMSDSQGEATMTESTALLATETPRSSPWSRFWAGARRLWQQSDWTRYVGGDWIRTIMSRPVTDRFSSKQGRSTGRMILPPQPTTDDTPTEDAEPLRIYLKRHYQLPWVNRLLALLWPSGRWSPAMQEMHHLEKARRLGVPVPEVVAAGEFIGPGFQLQSFLAVKELTGMLPLHEAIPLAAERLSPEDFARWKRGLILEMARLCRLLHDRNWFHKDLYRCHFYIDESFTHAAPNDWRDRVVMIDLHRLGHHPWTWAVWQMKDLAQLLYSSEITGITDRDRLLFWRAYQGPKPRPWWDPWLRWLVVLKWRRYRAHNLRHAARRAIEKQELAVPALTTEDQA